MSQGINIHTKEQTYNQRTKEDTQLYLKIEIDTPELVISLMKQAK